MSIKPNTNAVNTGNVSSSAFMFNFDGVEAASGFMPFLVPDGDYLVHVLGASAGTSKNGNGKIELDAVTVSDVPEYNNLEVWPKILLSLTPKGAPYVVMFLEAAGIPKPRGMVDMKALLPMFKDTYIVVTLKQEKTTYEGKEYTRMKTVKYKKYEEGL